MNLASMQHEEGGFSLENSSSAAAFGACECDRGRFDSVIGWVQMSGYRCNSSGIFLIWNCKQEVTGWGLSGQVKPIQRALNIPQDSTPLWLHGN